MLLILQSDQNTFQNNFPTLIRRKSLFISDHQNPTQMKIIILTLTLIILSVFTSCGKGEDDPALSLRTRKARITGEWKVTLSHSESTNEQPQNYYRSISDFDGATLTTVTTQTFNNEAFSTTVAGPAEYTYTFRKDNTYERSFVSDSSFHHETGTWTFVGKSKENDVKNKEGIMLIADNYSSESITYTSDHLSGYVILIKELRNNKMAWETNYSAKNSTGSSTLNSDQLTLKKK